MFMSSVGKLRLQNREKKIMRYYDDMGPGKGNCTVGYGSKVHSNPCTDAELKSSVTDELVQSLFSANLRDAERGVERHVKVPLTQEQFDALVSYTFNVGARHALPVFTLINRGDLAAAANVISRNTTVKIKKAGKTVRVVAGGLISRRAEESAPFKPVATIAKG
jgi:GH24 family phage-related lysozyme (muramidase)